MVATSVERNVPYSATTNTSGRYVIQFLLPGHYVVTVEKAGFKKYVGSDISLLASDQRSLDVRLEVGAVSESITVAGEVPLLQTESATTKSTFENKLIEDVPSGGRNIFALKYDQPGVVKTSTYWGSMELYASGNVNGVSIGGGYAARTKQCSMAWRTHATTEASRSCPRSTARRSLRCSRTPMTRSSEGLAAA